MTSFPTSPPAIFTSIFGFSDARSAFRHQKSQAVSCIPASAAADLSVWNAHDFALSRLYLGPSKCVLESSLSTMSSYKPSLSPQGSSGASPAVSLSNSGVLNLSCPLKCVFMKSQEHTHIHRLSIPGIWHSCCSWQVTSKCSLINEWVRASGKAVFMAWL